MNDRTKIRLEMLKRKVGAKSQDQLIYSMCRMIYDLNLFEELKEGLK